MNETIPSSIAGYFTNTLETDILLDSWSCGTWKGSRRKFILSCEWRIRRTCCTDNDCERSLSLVIKTKAIIVGQWSMVYGCVQVQRPKSRPVSRPRPEREMSLIWTCFWISKTSFRRLRRWRNTVLSTSAMSIMKLLGWLGEERKLRTSTLYNKKTEVS